MAEIRLNTREAEEGRLPCVCMRCGIKIAFDEFVERQYFFLSFNLGRLSSFLIPVLPAIKSRIVVTPICPDHAHHWRRQTSLLILAKTVIFVSFIVIALKLSEGDFVFGDWPLSKMILFGCIFMVLNMLTTLFVVRATAIAPTQITDDYITLTGVSERFVAEFQASRARRRSQDDTVPSRPSSNPSFPQSGEAESTTNPQNTDDPSPQENSHGRDSSELP